MIQPLSVKTHMHILRATDEIIYPYSFFKMNYIYISKFNLIEKFRRINSINLEKTKVTRLGCLTKVFPYLVI